MDAKRIINFLDKNDIQFEEVNRGDQKLKTLYRFDEENYDNDFASQLKTFVGLLLANFSCILTVSSSHVMITLGYFFISRETDLQLQAAMGIAVTYYKFFHTAFIESIGEKVGINCSKEYGAKLYQSMVNTFYKGIFLQMIYLLLVTIPAFAFSDSLLNLFIEDLELCKQVHKILVFTIPVAVVQSLNATFRSYINAQGIEAIFVPASIISVTVSGLMAWVFLLKFKMGILGWVLFRLFFELMKMFFSLYILVTRIDPNTIGHLDTELLKQTFKTFLYDALQFSLSFYLEFMGIETSIFFVGNLKNYREIVSYVSFMNFMRIMLSVGKGFSVILRTRINLFIGKLQQKTAENFFWFFYVYLLGSGLIFGALSASLSSPIARIYTIEPDIELSISKMVFLISFALPLVVSLESVATALRSLWKTSTLCLLYISVLIFFNALLGWNLMNRFQLFAYGLSISLAFSITTTNLCCLFTLATFDWSLVDSKYKEYKKYSELIRRLNNMRASPNSAEQGLRFSTNGVPVELLYVASERNIRDKKLSKQTSPQASEMRVMSERQIPHTPTSPI